MRLHHVQVSCPAGGEDGFAPARKAHPALLLETSDALDALAVRLEKLGFPVRWDEDFPGYRRFHTVDGNGNRVELLASS